MKLCAAFIEGRLKTLFQAPTCLDLIWVRLCGHGHFETGNCSCYIGRSNRGTRKIIDGNAHRVEESYRLKKGMVLADGLIELQIR